MEKNNKMINANVYQNRTIAPKYPVFLDCAKLMEDDYWKIMFTDLAYGKPPKGIYITNKTIIVSSTPNHSLFFFNNKDANTLCRELHEFFTVKANICSQKDMINKTYTFNKLSTLLNTTKKDIFKNKDERNIFITKYISKMKQLYNLSTSEYNELSWCIDNSFTLKKINANDIIIQDDNIIKIKNLSFDEQSRKWSINENNNKQINIPKYSNDTPPNYMYSNWFKYIKKLTNS